MSNNKKQRIKQLLESSFYKNPEAMKEFLAPEIKIKWMSAQGTQDLGYEAFQHKIEQMGKSYEELNADFSHLIEEEETVAGKFTFWMTTIENPDEVDPVATFMLLAKFEQDLVTELELMSVLN